jgi:hypothetical protein
VDDRRLCMHSHQFLIPSMRYSDIPTLEPCDCLPVLHMVLALTMRPEIYLYLNTIANERSEGNAAMRLYGRMRAPSRVLK